MKLIDILVEETIENGWVWPEHANCITQDRDREIMPATCHPCVAKFEASSNRWFLNGSRIDCFTADVLASDYETAIITREQYEAALAEKEHPLPWDDNCNDDDGWIDWSGGECPVPRDTLVEVKFPDGITSYDAQPAGSYRWTLRNCVTDIAAYRLHQPQEVEMIPLDECDGSRAEDDLNECIGQDATPVWNGEGLPPVGIEIEYKFAKANYRTDFSRGKVLAYGMHNVFMEHWASKNEFIQSLDKIEFRPIRTEAERKRDAAISAMMESLGHAAGMIEVANIYRAIAAGKIPGVKLEV